jgi:hypothetical protein
MSAIATHHEATADVRPAGRQLGGLALGVAPVVLLVARLLATPISNEPRDFVADVHASAGQTELGAALAIVAALLLAPTLRQLAQAARDGSRRIGLAAGVLTVIGCTGLVLLAAMQAVGARLSVQGLTAAQGADLFDKIYNTGALPVVAQLAIVCGAVGGICLGVGLFRSGSVSRPAAVISGVGTVMVFATAPGPVRPLLVVAAAVAAVGYATLGRTLRTG